MERDETISICNVGRRERKIFSLVKGKKTPLSFQFVMMLKPDLSTEFLAKYNLAVREDEIAGLFINILYDRQGLKCTSECPERHLYWIRLWKKRGIRK